MTISSVLYQFKLIENDNFLHYSPIKIYIQNLADYILSVINDFQPDLVHNFSKYYLEKIRKSYN
jgi:hypothetical protein